jgi:hypothetical protein
MAAQIGSAWLQNGEFVRVVGEAGNHKIFQCSRGGP